MNIHIYRVKLACATPLVVCLHHALSLISMHFGLLGSEFSELSCFYQTCMSCALCGLSLLWFVPYFNALWITSGWVRWNSVTADFLFVLWLLFVIICCLFQCTVDYYRRWVQRLSTFQIKPACVVHFVVCLCHALLLISMHCGLLDGESSDCPCFKSNLHVLFFLWFVFIVLCLLFQYFVDC